jgi:hypothetical protein
MLTNYVFQIVSQKEGKFENAKLQRISSIGEQENFPNQEVGKGFSAKTYITVTKGDL